MKFNILVNEGPYTHQASDTAYHFVCAALNAGHEVVRVFFYQDGVYNANLYGAPPVDDRDIVARWIRLSEEFSIELAVCVAASARRGVVNSEFAKRLPPGGGNLDQHFQVAGFGYFVEGSIIADRTLVFGD